ncbi:hypothetical protein, partial [Komagataeibacter oboediens]|uniref:hypothetical protein n=1 Tax=Komagataeibacter oboediens TaxID=65958 RepID=UPI001C6499F1
CVLNRMDIDRLDPHAHTTDSKALSSLKNFRIGLSDLHYAKRDTIVHCGPDQKVAVEYVSCP